MFGHKVSLKLIELQDKKLTQLKGKKRFEKLIEKEIDNDFLLQ